LLNNYDINYAPDPDPWFLGNIPTWPLFKTDMAVYTNFANRVYLPGAVFDLLVYNGTGTPAAGTLVTPNMVGPASEGYPWSLVVSHTSGGPGSTPMPLPMQQGRTYQLVEVLAPAGHQIPFGQWRITQPATLTLARNLAITPIGDAPTLYRPVAGTALYYIGNRTDIRLPMAGGFGSSQGVMAVGAALVASGGVVAYWYVAKQKRRKLSPIVNRRGLDS